jgi:hypothetical protein
MGPGNFPLELALLLAVACTSSAPRTGAVDAPAPVPVPPPQPARAQPLTVEPICEPGELETCVCADGSSGARRCNAGGAAFSACDACPDGGASCGARSCSPVRVGPIGLTLPPCCPRERPDRCGIEVSFVARNYGLTVSCLEFDAPGERDPSCPSTEVPFPEHGLLRIPGCRTPSGSCGYDVDVPGVIDLGCVDVRR